MLPRFIELANAQYRLQQQISEGATGKVFLAKRRSLQKKEVLMHINTVQTDQSQFHLERTQVAKVPKSFTDLLHNNRTAQQAQKFKQQQIQIQQRPKFETKNAEQPKDTVSTTKTKTNEVWQGEPCAIKCLSLQHGNQMQSLQKDYWIQLQMLQQLKHPGIVSLLDHGIIEDQKKKSFFIVLEWGIGGNFSRLIDLVHERSHFFNKRDEIFKFYAAQLVEIISYLQSRGISHRDIKAQNLILDKFYRLRLIDFGVAQIFDQKKGNFRLKVSSQTQQLEEARVYIGSKHHLSPQMIQRSRECKDLQIYSKTDIWSVGVVIYYMLTRTYPYTGINTFHIIDSIRVKQADFEKISDPQLVSLLKKMMQKMPQNRADISQIKAHEYFKGINFQKIFQAESPILKIIRGHSEQYFYTGEAIVRISGVSHIRVVGIFRRSSLSKSRRLEVNNRKDNIIEPIFNKNQSQVTQSNSEKQIGSQEFLQTVQGHMTFKYFLSIAKKEAKSIPKHLQIDQNTKLEVSKLTCLLKGVKFNVQPEVQQPDCVQLHFSMQQELDKFVTRFGDMFRGE